jgi:hypothetical protein
MKLIIAGGRDYDITGVEYAELDALHHRHNIEEVVSGACPTGADACGEEWAKRNSIPVKRFPAQWKTDGKAAGPIRNRRMAEYADAVVLFPGGRGTQSMCNEAKRAGITIFDRRGQG